MNASPEMPPLRSCLYECRVMHHRRHPRQHRFEYGLFLACLDLDELDALHTRLRWFSRNRRNLYEFRDTDHFTRAPGSDDPAPAGGIRAGLTAWLATQGVSLPAEARVQLVTLPRVLGYVFNPVSFYFASNPDGSLLFAVAEVGNTFGEQKPYLVPVERGDGEEGRTRGTRPSDAHPSDGPMPGAGRFRLIAPKHFYVSPFSALDLRFDFRLQMPGERLVLGVNDLDAQDKTVLISAVTGIRRPLSDAELLRLTLRYPLVTARVITLIHWQALRLWWKKLPFHRKSDHRDLQRDVLHPHPVNRSRGGH